MARRATVAGVRAARTTTVTIDVVDEHSGELVEEEYVIQRIKSGARKRLQAESVDDGILDLEQAGRLAVHLCVVDPPLSLDDVEHMDVDAVEQLADKIAAHSNLENLRKAATPDPQEGADAAAGFLDEGPEPAVDAGVAGDRPDDGDRVDA